MQAGFASFTSARDLPSSAPVSYSYAELAPPLSEHKLGPKPVLFGLGFALLGLLGAAFLVHARAPAHPRSASAAQLANAVASDAHARSATVANLPASNAVALSHPAPSPFTIKEVTVRAKAKRAHSVISKRHQ